MKAVGYTRVSTRKQGRSGLSLAAQEKAIEGLCEAKGWTLTEVVREVDSGGNRKRKKLLALLAGLQESRVEALVVSSLDRLTRSQAHLWKLIEEELEPSGVGLVSCKESFDTTSAVGRMTLGILGVFAQLERDLVSERTRAAIEQLRSNGKHWGPVPYGYYLADDGTLQEDPVKMEVVEMMKEARRQGVAYRSVAMMLDELGYPRPGRAPRWDHKSVWNIVHHPIHNE